MNSDVVPVCLMTDFGLRDPYVGIMKSVIQSEPPYPPVIDLTHEVPPQDERTAAFLLEYALGDCPREAVVLLVVDPGVGTERDIVVVETQNNRKVVAPDTGMVDNLDWSRARRLTNRDLARDSVSSTFHGRDWFAPVGRHLSLGGDFNQLGPPVESPETEGLVPEPILEQSRIKGEIVHVDRFGNLISNVKSNRLKTDLDLTEEDYPRLRLKINGRVIHGIAPTYGSEDSLIGVIGSFERVEVALPDGSAQDRLGVSRGESLEIYLAED